jgi:transcriptional regulator with XRE-family HTH domain
VGGGRAVTQPGAQLAELGYLGSAHDRVITQLDTQFAELGHVGSGTHAPCLYYSPLGTSYRGDLTEQVREAFVAAYARRTPVFISYLGQLAGTGGFGNALFRVISSSGLEFISSASQSADEAEERAPTPARMLAVIRAAFGTNVSQTARVLRVERPTIYAWLREEATPRLVSLQRLLKLYALAREWSRYSEQPASRVLHQPLVDNRSLFELLQEDPLREFVVSQQLRSLARSSPSTPEGMARSIRRKLGLSSESASGNDELMWLTRQSLGPES